MSQSAKTCFIDARKYDYLSTYKSQLFYENPITNSPEALLGATLKS